MSGSNIPGNTPVHTVKYGLGGCQESPNDEGQYPEHDGWWPE